MTSHRYQRIGRGAWCACGQYLGGLGFEDARRGRRTIGTYAQERHRLHLVMVRNG